MRFGAGSATPNATQRNSMVDGCRAGIGAMTAHDTDSARSPQLCGPLAGCGAACDSALSRLLWYLDVPSRLTGVNSRARIVALILALSAWS